MTKLISFKTAQLAKKRGFTDNTIDVFFIHSDNGSIREFNDWIGDETDDELIFRPTQDHLQTWLESKGMFVSIAPEFYTEGINWNWQVLWYLPKEKWEWIEDEDENGNSVKHPSNIVTGTGWYGDNGEFPTRHEALEAALHMALMKLDIMFRNNSVDLLAKLYGVHMNTMIDMIRPFSAELGDWSFREFTTKQLEILVKHIGEPNIQSNGEHGSEESKAMEA